MHFLLAAMDLSKAFSVKTHTLTLLDFLVVHSRTQKKNNTQKPDNSTLVVVGLLADNDTESRAYFNYSHTKHGSG